MTPLKIRTFILPKILTAVFVIALFVCALAYIMFQARFLINGPQLTITDPLPSIQNERQITLTGTASNVTEIYLNGRPIVTDENGTFSEKVVLENGYTIVRIDAIDLYGRATYIEQPFVYQPSII